MSGDGIRHNGGYRWSVTGATSIVLVVAAVLLVSEFQAVAFLIELFGLFSATVGTALAIISFVVHRR